MRIATGPVALQKEGEFWTVVHEGPVIRLKDSKGLQYLDVLLRHPETELHALDVASGGRIAVGPRRPPGDAAVEASGAGDAGAVLDAQAKADYRQRIGELEDEVDEAESFNDPERAERARAELDFISRELAAAVGLGGRDRKAASTSERARVNVTRSIRSAIRKIAENDQALGRYLEATVRTGTFCCYSPLTDSAPAAEPAAALASGAGPGEAVPFPPGLVRDEGTRFVGRREHTDHLRAAWGRALGSDPQLELLVGEPGIGKTRLALEVARELHSRRATVLYGRSYEDTLVPYQPLVEALGRYTAACSAARLRAELGPAGGELVRLLPDLRERVPDLPAAVSGNPEGERYRLFQAIAQLVSNASRSTPMLIVLDDLHWADPPTLLLLQHVVRSATDAPWMIVGTYRDADVSGDHPLAATLGDLRRDHPLERLVLDGLPEADVQALIESRSGREAEPAFTRAVYERTEGNPFFVEEVLRSVTDAAETVDIGIPEGVKEVIGRRLQRLSCDTQRVLAVASVIGREFELDPIEALEPDGGDALDAVEQAVRAGLVIEEGETVGRYAFSHALVRETLYGELTATRKARLHRDVGLVLERLHEGDLQPHLGPLAYHFFEAGRTGDLDRALEYAVRAADRAIDQLAYEEAIAHYERALELLESRQHADEGLRCETMIGLGEAQRYAAHPAYRETLLEAGRMAAQLGDGRRAARAALANNRGFFSAVGAVDRQRIQALESALALLPDKDDPLRAECLARLALELTYGEDRGRRSPLSDEALEIARRLGDDRTRASVLLTRYVTFWGAHGREIREAAVEEAAPLVRDLDDRWLMFWSAYCGIHLALESGEAAAARAHADEAMQLANELHQDSLRWFTMIVMAMEATLFGPVSGAEERAKEAFRLGMTTGEPDALAWFSTQFYALRLLQGRLGEVDDAREQMVQLVEQLPSLRWIVAALGASRLAETGRTEEAHDALGRLAANDLDDVPHDFAYLATIGFSGLTAARLGDRRVAALAYDRLKPFAGRVVDCGPAILGLTDLYLAVAADAGLGEAAGHFAAALEHAERIGARPWLPIIRLEWARAHLAYGRPAEAASLLTAAAAQADEDGLPALAAAARALLIPVSTRTA